jgi:hypothetical protein
MPRDAVIEKALALEWGKTNRLLITF